MAAATTAPCDRCGKRHRSQTAIDKCASAGLRAPAAPPAAPRPARVTRRDVLDVLVLRDGRLVIGATGGVLPVAPSIPGYGALPRQIVTNHEVVAILIAVSGVPERDVIAALNQALRIGRPLTDLLPERLLDVLVAEVQYLASDLEVRLSAQTTDTFRSAA